jgi:hypothetical protein
VAWFKGSLDSGVGGAPGVISRRPTGTRLAERGAPKRRMANVIRRSVGVHASGHRDKAGDPLDDESPGGHFTGHRARLVAEKSL